jgi:hypothetical protein
MYRYRSASKRTLRWISGESRWIKIRLLVIQFMWTVELAVFILICTLVYTKFICISRLIIFAHIYAGLKPDIALKHSSPTSSSGRRRLPPVVLAK